MRCAYCDVEVTEYPANGICVCCGGKLPPRPAPQSTQPQPVQAQPVYVPVQPVYIPVPPQAVYAPSCPKCRSTQVCPTKRGFSWGLGILGFFLLPGFGILLGFCGSKKNRMKCTVCNHKWKYL